MYLFSSIIHLKKNGIKILIFVNQFLHFRTLADINDRVPVHILRLTPDEGGVNYCIFVNRDLTYSWASIILEKFV